MGSPLGPVLADILDGFCEVKMGESMWPDLYVRFVDDSFTYLNTKHDSEVILDMLNYLHPSILFTCKHEQSNQFSFREILVQLIILN